MTLSDELWAQAITDSGAVPPDFGGLTGVWLSKDDEVRVVIVRFGEGRPQGAIRLTPLNLLQLRSTLDVLIEEGEQRGFVKPEHHEQSAFLPTSRGGEKILPRAEVDRIAGTD